MSEPELWSVHDIANEYGISYNAAYKALKRLDLTHSAFGRAGALLYDPDTVRAAWSLLPGSGTWKRRQGERGASSGNESQT